MTRQRQLPESCEPGSIRLQKYLAMAGYGSRRACETLIAKGQVRVRGISKIEPGCKVTPGVDAVFVRGRQVTTKPSESILFNKPRGWTCNVDERHPNHSIVDLNPELKAYPVLVGLPRDASGLILLSTDGHLHQRMKAQLRNTERRLNIRVKEEIKPDTQERLMQGISLDGVRRKVEKLRFLKRDKAYFWYDLYVRDLREQWLEKMFLIFQHPIQRMRQVAVAGVQDGLLKQSHARLLTTKEVRELRAHVGLEEEEA